MSADVERAAHELDVAALERWLRARLPGLASAILRRIGGGQSNPTWSVDWGDARLVLRKKPEGEMLPGAHAVEREFRVLRAQRPDTIGLSDFGRPLADLGFCVLPWYSSPEGYGSLLGTDWRAAGIPESAEFIETCHAHARPTGALQPFHIAFALFRFSVIFVGIADRVRAGSAALYEAAALAPLARKFAERGAALIGTSKKTEETAL